TEYSRRTIDMVGRLKQTKAADVRVMERVVVWIVARHDAADDFAISLSEEERGVTVLVKRLAFAIEKCFALDNQRRDPGRIISIDQQRKLDKLIQLFAVSYLYNFALRIGFST